MKDWNMTVPELRRHDCIYSMYRETADCLIMCRIRGSVNVGFVVTIFCEYQNMTNLMLHIVYEYVQLNRVLCTLEYSLVRK